MSNFKKDIEKLYSENFESFEMKPSKNVWDNLERELNKAKFTKFSFSNFNIYYLLAGFLLIIGVSIYLSNIDNQNNIVDNLQDSKEISTEREINTPYYSVSESEQSENLPLTHEEIEISNDISYTKNHENNTNLKTVEISITEKEKQFEEELEKISQKVEEKFKCEKFDISECVGCSPLSVKFTNNIDNIDNCKWSFGTGETSTITNPEYTFTNPGTYLVTMEYQIDDVLGYFYDTIVVFEKPKADFEIISSDNILKEEEIEFENNSENADYYNWSFGDNSFSDEENPLHKYLEIGSYTVKLFATTTNNCIDSIITSLSVSNEKFRLVFPNSFTPSLSGSNGGYYNINSKTNDVFYPVYADPIENYELTIYNRQGYLLFKSEDINIGWDGYFDGVLVSSGVYVYLVKVKFANGKTDVKFGDITVIYK